MSEGWVKLHRKIWENPVVTHDPDHLTVWVWILTHATHQEYQTWWEGKRTTLQPGQWISGRKQIAKETKLSQSKVQRILDLFESEQQIEQQKTPRGRLITVINWEKYQQTEQESEQQLDNNWTTTGQQLNTKQEYKNNKNERIKENIYTPQPPKQKKAKDPIVLTEDESRALAFLQVWNAVHGTALRAYQPIVKNLKYWLGIYSADEIKQAILNVKQDEFWKNKMTPVIFLRRKNPQGEEVDRISDMLNNGRQKVDQKRNNTIIS